MHAQLISIVLVGIGLCLVAYMILRNIRISRGPSSRPPSFNPPPAPPDASVSDTDNIHKETFSVGPGVTVTKEVRTEHFNIPPAVMALIQEGKVDDAAATMSREMNLDADKARLLVAKMIELRKQGGAKIVTSFRPTVTFSRTLTRENPDPPLS